METNELQEPISSPNNVNTNVNNTNNQTRKENDKTNPVNPNRVRSYPKKRIVLLLSYCGENYAGLQRYFSNTQVVVINFVRNNNVWTVEHALEKALVEKGVVSQDNAGSFTKVCHSTLIVVTH